MLIEEPTTKLTKHQAGLLLVVVEDFSLHRLPRLQILKSKVDNGETFSDIDVDFMKESIDGALRSLPMSFNNNLLHEFFAHVAALYNELTRKALENEIRTNN